MKKAVFLDRDGVLNRALVYDGVPTPPRSLGEVEILSGVKQSILLLNENNYEIVVVTNQPDVTRGTDTRESVNQINDYLKLKLGLDHFYTCFHDDSTDCNCRKPKPGLILKAAVDLGLDLHQCSVVGDRWRDIAAGQAAGCKTFFIDYSYPEKQPRKPFIKVSSLIEAAEMIIGGHHGT